MKYKLLGKSGLRVSELCLGTMTFGEEWGFGSNKEESRKVFEEFVASGGNFFDTANKYTEGTSERYLGEFIKGERDRYVIATKYSGTMFPGDPNGGGNSRKNLIQSLEASLKRLNTDYIDLFWLHIWDFTTPIEEVMRTFDDLIRAGKIRYAGISDAPAWIVANGNTIAQLNNMSEFVALQVEYSLIQRTPELELFPMAEHFGMTVTPWSPLAGGILSGKYNGSLMTDDMRLKVNANFHQPNERNLKIASKVVEIAKELGKTPSQVALSWMMKKKNILPIIGARKVSQLKDNLGSVNLELSGHYLDSLDAVSAYEKIFPYNFYEKDRVNQFVFGEMKDKLECFSK